MNRKELEKQIDDLFKDRRATNSNLILREEIKNLFNKERSRIVSELEKLKIDMIPELEGFDGMDCQAHNQAIDQAIAICKGEK